MWDKAHSMHSVSYKRQRSPIISVHAQLTTYSATHLQMTRTL